MTVVRAAEWLAGPVGGWRKIRGKVNRKIKEGVQEGEEEGRKTERQEDGRVGKQGGRSRKKDVGETGGGGPRRPCI